MDVIKTGAVSNRLSSLKIVGQSTDESEKADDTCAGSTPAYLSMGNVVFRSIFGFLQ